jgi:heptosyltransferase-3
MSRFKDWGKFLEKGGKALVRESLVRLLPRSGPPSGPVDPAAVSRVLAVRQDARLGNVLLLTPALRLINTAFPNACVDVLLADAYGEALRFNPCVHEILGLSSLPFLRARGYDMAFDFSPQHAFSLSSAVWTALSGAKRKVGFDRGDAARFLDDLVPVPTAQAHETANLAALVRHAAPSVKLPSDAELRTEWHFSPGEREEGKKIWASWGLDAGSPALFLGARAEKRLPAAWFMELASRVRAAGRKVALCGGPAERALLSGASLPEGVFLAPELPLRQFASTVSHAAAVLTADTGPMHLSVAVGVKTVELFSHTEPWRFGYGWMSGHRVLDTPGRHPTVDEAFAALSAVLHLP